MRWTFVALVAACATVPPPAHHAPEAPEVPAGAERHYAIWLGGAQVGTAHETEAWSATGVVVRRTETMRFLRGDVPVAIATTIEIAADRTLAPSRVTWSEQAQAVHRGTAVRDPRGWLVTDDAGVRRLPGAAIPAELAPLVVRRDGRFAGPVFLPARGFVVGTGRIEPVDTAGAAGPRRLIARLALDPGAAGPATNQTTSTATNQTTSSTTSTTATNTTASTTTNPATNPAASPATSQSTSSTTSTTASTTTSTATNPAASQAAIDATIDLGEDGMPVRVVDGEGVIATRITAAQAAAPFAPVDLIAATSVPLAGAGRRLVLDGPRAVPAVPGQRARAIADGVELELSAQLRGGLPPGPPGADRTREITALVARVHRRIAPDLAAGPARAAATATAGDCTTFALAYAALAGQRGLPTFVVTGFRVDRDRLVRHRWAVSWTGRAWIAVDAAFGAVPAGGDLVALAIHDADDVGLVAGEAALTQLRAAVWR